MAKNFNAPFQYIEFLIPRVTVKRHAARPNTGNLEYLISSRGLLSRSEYSYSL